MRWKDAWDFTRSMVVAVVLIGGVVLVLARGGTWLLGRLADGAEATTPYRLTLYDGGVAVASWETVGRPACAVTYLWCQFTDKATGQAVTVLGGAVVVQTVEGEGK